MMTGCEINLYYTPDPATTLYLQVITLFYTATMSNDQVLLKIPRQYQILPHSITSFLTNKIGLYKV